MSDTIEKEKFDGTKIEILGPSYEKGKPENPVHWKRKLSNRKDYLNYLKQSERYWYNDDWFGSEKRKNPA